MTPQGEFVLCASADLVLEGQILSRQTHVQSRRTVPIEIPRVGGEARLLWDVVHMFDATGDLHIFAVGRDTLRCLMNGLEAGATVAVDRGAGNLNR